MKRYYFAAFVTVLVLLLLVLPHLAAPATDSPNDLLTSNWRSKHEAPAPWTMPSCRNTSLVHHGPLWESVKAVVTVLNRVHADYFLVCGTLLGFVRDCQVNHHKQTDDIDFGNCSASSVC